VKEEKRQFTRPLIKRL